MAEWIDANTPGTTADRLEYARWHDARVKEWKSRLAHAGTPDAQANCRSYVKHHTDEARRLRNFRPEAK